MIQGSYSPGLVGMSIVVAIVAAYTAIDMARRIASASAHDRASRWWLAGGACAMGTGIWSMHFVGMLAFKLPMPVGYAPGITLLSWLIGIAASGFALWLTARKHLSPVMLAVGALVMGGGICGMHYTGMAAMRMQPAIDYEPWLVALSIVIAVVAAGVGLFIIHHLRTARRRVNRLRFAAAVLIGASIVGMHYTAMAAARFPLDSICGAAQYGLHNDWLAALIILGSLGVLTMALVISVLDQQLESRTAVLATSLAMANQELSHLAMHDALTKLPNRRLLEERLAQAIQAHARFALMLMDLDGFKNINDAFGHHLGDRLLVEVAHRLASARRSADTVARQGGDEFVVLVRIESRDEAELAARRLLDLVLQPITIGNHQLNVSSSIGIALYPDDGADPAVLLSNADAAMYRAKERGRNGYQFFEPAMNKQALTHLQLGQALAPALERGEFFLVYQPKYGAIDNELAGVEALVRWDHPGRGVVDPDVFIPLAERTGLIIELGAWILDEACRQLAEWHRHGQRIRMSVNLSVLQFGSPRLLDDVTTCLARHAVPPQFLILEITESIAMRDVEHSQQILRQLCALGVAISIDDFGTGYSSLVYLTRLPASELKIDRAFVQNLHEGQEDAAIVSAIIALGKALGLTITAEGVETVEQQAFLTRQGCDLLQGHLLGRPARAEALRLFANRPRVQASASA
ncbi:MAG: putative bifunctional diguanylate cyclase/phosphodiesterase [Rhodanobacteraceae bacterium]